MKFSMLWRTRLIGVLFIVLLCFSMWLRFRFLLTQFGTSIHLQT